MDGPSGSAYRLIEKDSIDEWEEAAIVPTGLIKNIVKDHDDWADAARYSEAERDAACSAIFHIYEIIDYLEDQDK